MKYEIKLLAFYTGIIGLLLTLSIFGLAAVGGIELVHKYEPFIDFMLFMLSGAAAFHVVFDPFGLKKPRTPNTDLTEEK